MIDGKDVRPWESEVGEGRTRDRGWQGGGGERGGKWWRVGRKGWRKGRGGRRGEGEEGRGGEEGQGWEETRKVFGQIQQTGWMHFLYYTQDNE